MTALNLLAVNLDMNLLYIIFGVLFGIIIVAAVALLVCLILVSKKRKEIADRRERNLLPQQIEGENVVIRIEEGRLQADIIERVEVPVETPAPVAVAPVAATAPEEPAEEQEEETPEGTFLPRAEKLTFEEKMAQLKPEILLLLGAFRDYVAGQPDCEQLQQANAIAFRYKKAQIAKAVIRRESVILNFAIVNPDLGRMAKEEKGGLKIKPVEIRLTDDDTLEVAKQTADLTIGYLKQEEAYKIEKRKEARREAARKKREEAAVTDEAAPEELPAE